MQGLFGDSGAGLKRCGRSCAPLVSLDLKHTYADKGVHRGRPVRGRSAVLLVWANLDFKRWMTLGDIPIYLATLVLIMRACSIPEAQVRMSIESLRLCGFFSIPTP